jgi:predicted DNA-binding WGR domain protein
VRFGRIGTAGQAQTKSFGDINVAHREAEKLIAAKVRKGYQER